MDEKEDEIKYRSMKVRWIRRKVEAIKYLGGKCSRCGGVFHPVCYDFHHRNPAEKQFVWTKIRQMSWDKVHRELDKCDLLCVHCHRVEHINQALWVDLWDQEVGWDGVLRDPGRRLGGSTTGEA